MLLLRFRDILSKKMQEAILLSEKKNKP